MEYKIEKGDSGHKLTFTLAVEMEIEAFMLATSDKKPEEIDDQSIEMLESIIGIKMVIMEAAIEVSTLIDNESSH